LIGTEKKGDFYRDTKKQAAPPTGKYSVPGSGGEGKSVVLKRQGPTIQPGLGEAKKGVGN